MAMGINVPDVRYVMFPELNMNVLTNANQPVFAAAAEPEKCPFSLPIACVRTLNVQKLNHYKAHLDERGNYRRFACFVNVSDGLSFNSPSRYGNA